MTSHDPIAYTYDADTHCPPCAQERFGRCRDGFIACPDDACGGGNTDSEGNSVGAIFPWDEWCEPSEPGTAILACGTCHGVIEEHEHDGSDGTATYGAAVPSDLAGDDAWTWRTHVDGADFAASPAQHEEYDRWLSRELPGDPPAYLEGE